jgi:23S rRNA pseudouridine1911/1915/1917 synthase
MNSRQTELRNILVDEEYGGRIDVFLAERLEGLSRTAVQRLIENGDVLLNGKIVKPKNAVNTNDIITVNIPQPQVCCLTPENIPIDIVYEDDYIAVINKQRGLTVHPGSGIKSGTLVNALLYHIKNLSSVGGVVRPGIVHRIDKNTTGLLVVAKCDAAHIALSRQIENKTCRRIYRALCEGVIKNDEGRIIAPIGRSSKDRKKMDVVSGGKYAETLYRVLQRFSAWTYAEFELKTGRTHQIRVHLKYIGHPVVGDDVYGYSKQKFDLQGQLLHAYKLILIHPFTNQEMEFTAPLPEDFKKILNSLN